MLELCFPKDTRKRLRWTYMEKGVMGKHTSEILATCCVDLGVKQADWLVPLLSGMFAYK